jgi:hypothetical protein
MRFVHMLVICALIVAAATVYKIKFDSTVQAARVAKLRTELRRERDAIAVLRAEWARLDTPARIEGLAQRHLNLKPVAPRQIADFSHLPPRPPADSDPIADMLAGSPGTTGSVPASDAVR